MISQEKIDEVKEVLYNHYVSYGTKRIGFLEDLRNLLSNIINDTSPTKYRMTEMCHFLHGQGYLVPSQRFDDKYLFCLPEFYITQKLIDEMKKRAEMEAEDKTLKWY